MTILGVLITIPTFPDLIMCNISALCWERSDPLRMEHLWMNPADVWLQTFFVYLFLI